MDSCLCCGEITKYKCIPSNLSACNRSTVFEGNEETDFFGFRAGNWNHTGVTVA